MNAVVCVLTTLAVAVAVAVGVDTWLEMNAEKPTPPREDPDLARWEAESLDWLRRLAERERTAPVKVVVVQTKQIAR